MAEEKMAEEKIIPIQGWKGLNNKVDRTRLGPEWLERADDVELDQLGGMTRRDGCTQILTGIADSYSARGGDRAYLIRSSDTALLRFSGDAAQVIYPSVGNGPYVWADAGNTTFLLGAHGGHAIYPDMIEPWGVTPPSVLNVVANPGALPSGTYQCTAVFVSAAGRESGAPRGASITLTGYQSIEMYLPSVPTGFSVQWYITPPNGRDFYLCDAGATRRTVFNGPLSSLVTPLKTQFFEPPPRPAAAITFWDGRLWVAVHDQSSGFSRVFPSQPMGWHWFVYDDPDAIDVPGRVTVLAGTQAGLLIGTDHWIWSYAEAQAVLAEYAAMDQQPHYDDNGLVWFWTARGLAKFPQFENVTENLFAPVSGISAAILVRDWDGYRQVIAAPSAGGLAFNEKTQTVTI